MTDGSTVQLNSDTWMYVTFDNDTRTITLTRGEAYFKVAEEARPFKVAAGAGEVKTQGSTFEIDVVDESKMLITVE